MASDIACSLTQKKCKPCEGGVPPLAPDAVQNYLSGLPGWQLTENKKGIFRTWKFKDFLSAMDFLNHIAHVAEDNDHHPDFHLTGYRNVKIEMTTHAIDGLSENDFILAAKIDEVPTALKK
ncbi:MAG: 4a-hydroxytetrahydrobiopterin dehydratase [Planctomycetia bacterium]|nr:4a-hydroxytetrahydrobiopterin dehydratase [Planctomycetia bacterium]